MILTVIQFFSYTIPTIFGAPVKIIFVICKNIYINKQPLSQKSINQLIKLNANRFLLIEIFTVLSLNVHISPYRMTILHQRRTYF